MTNAISLQEKTQPTFTMTDDYMWSLVGTETEKGKITHHTIIVMAHARRRSMSSGLFTESNANTAEFLNMTRRAVIQQKQRLVALGILVEQHPPTPQRVKVYQFNIQRVQELCGYQKDADGEQDSPPVQSDGEQDSHKERSKSFKKEKRNNASGCSKVVDPHEANHQTSQAKGQRPDVSLLQTKTPKASVGKNPDFTPFPQWTKQKYFENKARERREQQGAALTDALKDVVIEPKPPREPEPTVSEQLFDEDVEYLTPERRKELLAQWRARRKVA